MIIEEQDQLTPREIAMFKLVHAYLYHSGKHVDRLTPWQRSKLWTLGDGYGNLSREELIKLELMYDWSHIRDSSMAAIERIFIELVEMIAT